MATFSVVVTAKEDKEVIDFFISHYTRLGAQAISVYYDGAANFDIAPAGDHVSFVAMDAAFWAEQAEPRPQEFTDLQRRVYARAMAECQSDWLLVVDCDEMLYIDQPVGTLLDKLPLDIHAVRIRNVEAVWDSGSDAGADFGTTRFRHFARTHTQRSLQKLVYRGRWKYLKHGLAGHSAGKHFLRKDADVDVVGIHTSRSRSRGEAPWLDKFTSDEALICHFDAISARRWKTKMINRSGRRGGLTTVPEQRVRLIRHAAQLAAERPDELDSLFEKIYTLQASERRLLSAAGLLIERDISRA